MAKKLVRLERKTTSEFELIEEYDDNVKVFSNGQTVRIEFDSTEDLGPSKSGKTNIISTTGGNQRLKVVGKEITIGFNAYFKK